MSHFGRISLGTSGNLRKIGDLAISRLGFLATGQDFQAILDSLVARHLHEVAEAKMDKDFVCFQKGCKLEDVGSQGVSDCHICHSWCLYFCNFLHMFVGFWQTTVGFCDFFGWGIQLGIASRSHRKIAGVLLTKSPL